MRLMHVHSWAMQGVRTCAHIRSHVQYRLLSVSIYGLRPWRSHTPGWNALLGSLLRLEVVPCMSKGGSIRQKVVMKHLMATTGIVYPTFQKLSSAGSCVDF